MQPLPQHHRLLASLGLIAFGLAGPLAANDAVKVPSFVGQAGKNAKAAAKSAGLTVQFQLGSPAPTPGKALHVYEQDPPPGTNVPPGSSVRLLIHVEQSGTSEQASAETPGGPAAIERTGRGSAPNVMGQSSTNAKAAILAAGFTPKILLGDSAPQKGKEFAVYDQLPAPGDPATPGGQILILIHAGATANSAPALSRVWAAPLIHYVNEAVDPRGGRLYFAVTDMVVPAGRTQLKIVRAFSSSGTGLLVPGWRMNWERRLVRTDAGAMIESSIGTIELTFDSSTSSFRAPSGDKLEIKGDVAIWTSTDGAKETFDREGRLSRRIEPNGELIVLNYDEKGRLVRANGPYGSYLAFSHDDRGRITNVDSSTGCAVRYVYGDDKAPPADAGRFKMLSVAYGYGESGLLARVDHPRYGATEYSYDAQGRVAAKQRSDGSRETYVRDDDKGTVRQTDSTGAVTTTAWSNGGRRADVVGPLGAKSSVDFDEAGRLLATTGPTGATMRIAYDPLGREIAFDDPASGVTRIEYVGDSKLISRIIGPGDRKLTLEYDADGRIIRTADSLDPSQTTTFAYFPSGRLRTTTNAAGQKRVIAYDDQGRLESVIDHAGGVWRYTYDGRGNVSRVTNPMGAATSYSFDEHNLMTSMTDESGAVVRFEYEQRGRLFSVVATDARGGKKKQTYDERGRCIEVRDAAGGVTRYGYDPAGRMVELVDAARSTWRFDHDAAGQVVRLTNPLGGTTQLEYDPTGRLVSQTSPTNGAIHREFSPQGRLSKQKDCLGRATTYGYDELGRLVRQSDDAWGTTQFKFTPAGALAQIIPPNGPIRAYERDRQGNVVDLFDGSRKLASFRYDSLGRRIKEILTSGLETSFRHDVMGQVIAIEDNLGGRETIKYDAMGRVVSTADSVGAATTLAYDAAGNLSKIANPLGREKKFEYDAANRLTQVVEPNGDLAGYDRDAAGRLTAVRHPGRGRTSLSYDSTGNVVKTIHPWGGETRSTYDPAGRLIGVTDPKGQTTSFAYDVASRLVERRLADGKTVRYEYDDKDRLVKVDDGTFPVLYSHDELGNVTSIEYPAVKRVLRYEYDEAGKLAKFVDSEGRATFYEYDSFGRLVAIRSKPEEAVTFAYDAKDRLVSMRYPNGVTGTRTYDSDDRLVESTYSGADGKSVAGWKYKYDAAGNRVETVDSTGAKVRYDYDPSGQLVAEQFADGKAARYGYVAGGNRAWRESGGEKTAYRYDNADRLLAAGDETFAYDLNGNLVERKGPRGTTRYDYDSVNRLVAVRLPDGKEVGYGYASTGERIWRREHEGTTHFVTDGMNVLAELDENHEAKATYWHGPGVDQPLATKRDGQIFYLHADCQGSVSRATDQTANVAASYSYDAFGQAAKSGSIAVPFTYAGREYDDATGLYYYRARYYDPSLGRFLSADLVEADATNLASLNPYIYAYNNPVNLTDPLGLAPPRGNAPQIIVKGGETFGVFYRGHTTKVVSGSNPQTVLSPAARAGGIQNSINTYNANVNRLSSAPGQMPEPAGLQGAINSHVSNQANSPFVAVTTSPRVAARGDFSGPNGEILEIHVPTSMLEPNPSATLPGNSPTPVVPVSGKMNGVEAEWLFRHNLPRSMVAAVHPGGVPPMPPPEAPPPPTPPVLPPQVKPPRVIKAVPTSAEPPPDPIVPLEVAPPGGPTEPFAPKIPGSLARGAAVAGLFLGAANVTLDVLEGKKSGLEIGLGLTNGLRDSGFVTLGAGLLGGGIGLLAGGPPGAAVGFNWGVAGGVAGLTAFGIKSTAQRTGALIRKKMGYTPPETGWKTFEPIPGSPAEVDWIAKQKEKGVWIDLPPEPVSPADKEWKRSRTTKGASGGDEEPPTKGSTEGARKGVGESAKTKNKKANPGSVLGPKPPADPNEKWPICPKCGKRHDPNEK